METLRLWPAVNTGTFRTLQFDDYCVGLDGTPTKLPKGTNVQIPNWLRHRSVELWGETAAEFNPDREWEEDELWGGQGEWEEDDQWGGQGTDRSFIRRYGPFIHS
jgi:cytochrome P450